tara:strand:- start:2618 stop:4252 length:1635 start_codon:yes stop_codon:yes gene_type:complete
VSETYTPPKSAINNAKRGLDLRKKYGRGGLTPAEAKSYGIDSGITRAKRISKGKLSRHDVRRMSAFNRHRQNYNPSKKMGDGGPTAGTIAWLLWGGTSGVNWAKKKSAAMNAESFEAESKMECPPATKDVAINTKNRNATIKNFDYGPLNVEEPGDFWKDIAEQWKTTEKAAKKSNCGNCVAFDRSPRMKACMPGETSDGEGVLGYCWMHHFKCHSARTCDTWAKGGPITTNKVSEGWQERAFAKSDKNSENFSSDWTEKSFNDGGGYDYTCMLILDIRDASKDYPLYTRIEEGSGFALKPLAIIKIKELILSGLNLNGVDYAGTTITAESIIFKFNFNNLDEAEDYFKYLNQHISIMMAKNHDEIPDNELCPHCMFSKVLIEVVDKYELGIKIANLIDWSNKEQTIDFLEYLIALENVDVEYVLNLLRGRGVNISKPNDYNGNSTKQLIVAEKNGYESMIEYIINELKNKKRSIDVVAFTLIADNGLKEQITNNIEQILKIDYSQLSSNLEKQLYLNQGKLAGIEDFLYYFYSDSSDFIFDNI